MLFRSRPEFRTLKRVVFGASLLLPLTIGEATGHAAPRYAERPLTMPKDTFALDVGFGFLNAAYSRQSFAGAGLNFEGAFSVSDRLELGVRSGVAFGDGRTARADLAGRTLHLETWGTRFGDISNPELRATYMFLHSSGIDLGVDARLFVPVEQRSYLGFMPGIPLRLRLGESVRVESGVYVPFTVNGRASLSVPLNLFIQAGPRTWVGPMLGLTHGRARPPYQEGDETGFLLGVGGKYQLSPAFDAKAMFFWPHINEQAGGRTFGLGIGLQARIE